MRRTRGHTVDYLHTSDIHVVAKNIDTVSRKGPLVANPIDIELIHAEFFFDVTFGTSLWDVL